MITTYEEYISALRSRVSENESVKAAALSDLDAFKTQHPEEYEAFRARKIQERKNRRSV